MIISQEVKNSMENELREFLHLRMPGFFGLPSSGIERDHDLPEEAPSGWQLIPVRE
jgi:hypothetical protein